MALFADHVPPLIGLGVAGEAVAPEHVDDAGEAALIDLCPPPADAELEEFPVVRGRVETLAVLDHCLTWDALHDRAGRPFPAEGMIGGGQRVGRVSEEVADIEAANRRHVADTAETVVADLNHSHGLAGASLSRVAGRASGAGGEKGEGDDRERTGGVLHECPLTTNATRAVRRSQALQIGGRIARDAEKAHPVNPSFRWGEKKGVAVDH